MTLFLEYVGFIGAFIIVCAWAFETIQSIEKHKSVLDLKFAVMYIFATSLMVVHSVAINDTTFIFLNSSILAAAVFEVLYTFFLRKFRKAGRKHATLKNKRGKR